MSEVKIPSFDKDTFMTNFLGMEDLAAEAIKSFLSTLPNLISDISIAIYSKNTSALEIAAHTLKGAVSNFYAEPSRLLASKLEVMGREKRIAGAEATFSLLERELGTLSLELSKIIQKGAA